MMDIVCAALRKEGIPYVRVDGSMLEHKRAAAIKAFQSSTPVSSHYEVPEVAVMSLKAAGVGLNLTAASQVRISTLHHRLLVWESLAAVVWYSSYVSHGCRYPLITESSSIRRVWHLPSIYKN